MAITFVGSEVGGHNATTLPAGDLVWPTVQADDFALLFWTMSDAVTPTTPSGFTQVATTDITSGTGRTYIFQKFCTGSEDGTDVGCTVSLATRQSAAIVVYRGVHLTTPISGSVAVQQSAVSTAHACAAATPTVANCVAVTSVHERLSTGDTAWTPPTGYTERADTLTEATGSGGTITGVADDGLASGRDTSPVTPPDWTGTVSTDAVLTYTLMLRPASTGTTHTVDQTDSAGLTDTLAKSIEKAVTDSAGLADTTAAELSSTTTDSAGLTDTAAVELSKLVSQTDSAGLTDTTANAVAQAVTDSAGLTDTTAVTRSNVVTDSAGLADTSLAESGKALAQTDSAGLTDAVDLVRFIAFTDSAGLADTFTAALDSATGAKAESLATLAAGRSTASAVSAGRTSTSTVTRR